MNINFEAVNSKGVVIESGEGTFGMHVDIVKGLQELLPALGDAEVAEQLTFNARLEQLPLEVIMGLAQEAPVLEAITFDAYVMPECTDDDEAFYFFKCEHEGNVLCTAGPVAGAYEHTVDKCPEGGIGIFEVPVEDWDEFVEEFCKLQCVD